MKLLRNPIVTSALVVAALGMVLYQTLPRRSTVVTAVTHALAPPPIVNVPHVDTNPVSELAPDTSIDRDYAAAHFGSWIESPARDPFLLIGAQSVSPAEIENTKSPIRKMRYSGDIDQTGARIAVIDGKPYKVGEEICEGYRLIQINGEEVLIQGPKAKERVGINQPRKSVKH